MALATWVIFTDMVPLDLRAALMALLELADGHTSAAGFDHWFATATQKDLGRRFVSAEEMAAERSRRMTRYCSREEVQTGIADPSILDPVQRGGRRGSPRIGRGGGGGIAPSLSAASSSARLWTT